MLHYDWRWSRVSSGFSLHTDASTLFLTLPLCHLSKKKHQTRLISGNERRNKDINGPTLTTLTQGILKNYKRTITRLTWTQNLVESPNLVRSRDWDFRSTNEKIRFKWGLFLVEGQEEEEASNEYPDLKERRRRSFHGDEEEERRKKWKFRKGDWD